MKIKAIYQIKNKTTGKIYIGSSISLENRWNNHKNSLFNNTHRNIYLQNAWNKYGEEDFKFEILEIFAENTLQEEILQKEQWYIDYTHCTNPNIGYNILITAGSPKGRKCSEETKKKMSKIRFENNLFKGRKHSDESKKKMSQKRLGMGNCKAKLNNTQVSIIKYKILQGICNKELSQEYQVSLGIINNIRKNITWKHIEPNEDGNVIYNKYFNEQSSLKEVKIIKFYEKIETKEKIIRRPLKEIWIERYGEEEGLKKYDELVKNRSKKSSAKRKGQKRTEEQRQRISDSLKGRKLSEKHIQKLKEFSEKNSKILDEEVISEIIECYCRTNSKRATSKETGYSRNFITKVLNKHNKE